MTQLAVESGWFHCGTARRTCSVGPGVKKATIVGWSACSARPLSTLPAIQPVSAVVQQKASSATSVCHFGPIQLKMSAAATFEDDMGGMDVVRSRCCVHSIAYLCNRNQRGNSNTCASLCRINCLRNYGNKPRTKRSLREDIGEYCYTDS